MTVPFSGALVAAGLLSLTGCVAYVRPDAGTVYVNPPAVEVEAADDYVYYPNYECYYSVSRHEYAYRDGDRWVSRSGPRGVSVDVLMASPSVHMNFHGSPAQHHADVVRQYPRNWRPAGGGQHSNGKDDQWGNGHGR